MSSPSAPRKRDAEYVMGHSAAEHERLEVQSRMLRPSTEEMMRRAGLARGMRVLDIGTGVGDVAMLAATFVGAEGSVLGLDSDPGAIAVARQRAASKGLSNVSFESCDFREFTAKNSFDALTGRLVLLFQADPAAALRHAAAQVKRGGIVAMQDVLLDENVVRSLPRVQLYHDYCRWVVESLRRGGADTNMGMRLHKVFTDAGLPAPQTASSTLLAHPEDDDFFLYLDKFIQPFVAKIIEFGIATAAEVDAANIAGRIRSEARRLGASLMWVPITSAWTRT